MYLIETSRGPVFGIEDVVSVPPKGLPAAETRNHYIYLRSKPETVYQRMKDRMRAEETSVSLEYLIEINQFYESWLASPYSNSLVISENEQSNCHILILNGTTPQSR